jgi:acyl-CoA thioester hydrolase
MPVIEMNAKYKRPALYDDLITVKTSVKELNRDSPQIQFHSELYNEAGKLLNEGVVTLVFVDSNTKKKINLPEVLVEKLTPYFE